jgi:hypothetical protein
MQPKGLSAEDRALLERRAAGQPAENREARLVLENSEARLISKVTAAADTQYERYLAKQDP